MYYRKAHGKGFSYKQENGKTIQDKETRDWIKSLVIPPAWTDVEISENRNARLLVTGRDDKERKQYLYNPKYTAKQNSRILDRILAFTEQLVNKRHQTSYQI